ncbi:unnamed protein product [Lactuca virosa]|uniref:PGG domain-containing protein n=1 Tax=Lactuca virosa TaxID=75947 RepID=A0AAU9NTD3_9ASTR|nr:unnamed protein product [Lactuca virosa]
MDRRLFQAAWNGDVDHLLREIDTNPSILHVMSLEGGETPLHIACLAGHLNFVATVVKLRQKSLRELNLEGYCPLHIAAACGHADIVKELLTVDLSLCWMKGKDRRIPLHLAVIKGNVGVVRDLLLASVDSVECTTAQGETSLHLAVKNNQIEVLQVLVEHLKQVNKENLLNFKDIHGNTVLHHAVSRKQYEVVDFLLNGQVTSKEKMELNSLNKSGLTPLDMLLIFHSEAGDRELEEIMVRSGAIKGEILRSVAYAWEERHHTHTRPENNRSPARNLLDYFKYNNLKDSPSIVRNTLLVIIILITTATYQPTLNPPGGIWQDDSYPSAGNITLSCATNNTTANKSHTAGRAIMGTHNPVAYCIFLFANSIGFHTSMYMIYVLTAAFPLRLELQISMFALATTYSICMSAISPNNLVAFTFMGINLCLQFMIPITTKLLRNYFEKLRNESP